MIKLLLRKCGIALVWLWVISLLAFWLSHLVPGDEILDYLSIEQGDYHPSLSPSVQREQYTMVAHKRGLDLPPFYFSIHRGHYPDDFFSIQPREDREAVEHWIAQSRDPDGALQLYRTLRAALDQSCAYGQQVPLAEHCCNQIHLMLVESNTAALKSLIHGMEQTIEQSQIQDVVWTTMVSNIKSAGGFIGHKSGFGLSAYVPAIKWNGVSNQYHQWIMGLISFKPLTSLIDGRNAWTKVLEALGWTLLINGLAFILAITLGCWIGAWSGKKEGRVSEKLLSLLLFAIFAIPSFWLATLMILLFSSGEWLTLLPSGGLGSYQTASGFFEKWGIIASHLVLPVGCLAIGSLAYVSRQMKQSVRHEMNQGYVHSLKAMGVSEKTILRKHVIRNAMFPMVTLMGHALPALLSGSLIIEVIFSIPGMGRLMYTSLLARDWPVAFPILMLGAAVTVFTYALTDVIYKRLDPRIKTE